MLPFLILLGTHGFSNCSHRSLRAELWYFGTPDPFHTWRRGGVPKKVIWGYAFLHA